MLSVNDSFSIRNASLSPKQQKKNMENKQKNECKKSDEDKYLETSLFICILLMF